MLPGEIQQNSDCGTENSEQDRKEKANNPLEKAKHAVFEMGHTIGQIALAFVQAGKLLGDLLFKHLQFHAQYVAGRVGLIQVSSVRGSNTLSSLIQRKS